ncbi:hypothetical protein PsorP6_016516 [Peronosclerospora sorghi]|uniref:Uncharacterized protein n=1 Tax=Peronosclerospora sorghi TaxID=230839 RepID=A0ACC0VQQ5_9STRA|nr:hypothetical protein PsorP6_016516 [Peronosclerospora sorghi]
MSSIEKLSIRGIRSFSPNREEIIEFYHPLTVLLGDNGCGKTTVIECLKLACTGGLPPGARSGQSLVHDPKLAGTNEVKASIRLRFRNRAGKAMVVQRTYQVRQTKNNIQFKALDGVIRVVNDLGEKVSLNHKCGELDQHIPDMLGVSKAILENVIFCHQEDSNWPLREGAELKKRFDQIFESARYTKALEAIRKLKKARLDNVKDYKRDLDVLSVNMKTADEIRQALHVKQDKLRRAQEEEEKGEEAIAEAQETVDELQSLQTEVKHVHDEVARRAQQVRDKEETVGRAYHKMEKVMSDSDDELKTILKDFDANVQDNLNMVQQLRREEKDVLLEQTKAKKEKEEIQASKTRVETNIELFQKELADFIDFASHLGTKYRFHLEPLSSQPADLSSFFTEFQSVVQTNQEAVNRLETSQRQEEEKLTTALSELQSQVKNVRSELKMKTQNLEALNREKTEISKRLRELGSAGAHSQQEAEEKSLQVVEAEKTLVDYRQKHDLQSLKHEIGSLDKRISDVSGEMEELGQEITMLRTYAHQQAELGIKRSEYRKRLDTFHLNLQEKVAEFDDVWETSDKPTTRATLVATLGRLETLVSERQRSCEEKKRQLVEAEKRLMENTTSSKLLERELNGLRTKKHELERREIAELKTLLDKILPHHQVQDAERGVQEAERLYAEAKEKVVRRKNMVLFLNIYKKKGLKDHACPLCERGMSRDEEQLFHRILSEKTDDARVAEKIQKAQEVEQMALQTLTSLRAKLPSWRKWMELEREVPEKVQALATVYAAQKALEYDVQDKSMVVTQAHEQLNETIRAQAALEALRKVADELATVDAMLAKEEERMKVFTRGHAPGGPTRSLEDVEALKDAKQAQVHDLTRELQRKQKDVQRVHERLQQLQNDVHCRKEAKLEQETQRKAYHEALKDQMRVRDEEKRVKEACLELKKHEPVLERELRTKMSERDAHRVASTDEMRAKRRALAECQGDFHVFRDKSKKVERKQVETLEQHVETLTKQLAVVETKEASLTETIATLKPQIQAAEDRLSKSETLKRHIQDNLDYRALEHEVKTMRCDLAKLETQMGTLPPLENVKQRVDAAQAALRAAQVGQATVRGKKEQLMENIRDDQVKLRTSTFKGIDEKYRHKLIQFETTQLAVADLERYYRALDDSLLQYHSKKVEEINTIIRSLWQMTYKGQDIDTIELVSGQQEGVVSKAARSYDYRVVMKKAGASIDMRGRCSAGQKVLAALVIRLALAETFCLYCGILALDEPTTNLDTENKFGLAQAMTEYEWRSVCVFGVFGGSFLETFLSNPRFCCIVLSLHAPSNRIFSSCVLPTTKSLCKC